VRASITVRVIDVLMSLVSGGAKAKVGPYGSLVVWGSSDHETAVATYQFGTTPQTEVVVQRLYPRRWPQPGDQRLP